MDEIEIVATLHGTTSSRTKSETFY